MSKIILEYIVYYAVLLAPSFASESTALTMLPQKSFLVQIWNKLLMPKSHDMIISHPHNTIQLMKDLSLRELMQRRRVVVHHTHLLKDQICQLLKPKDLVFFDDCLFSQYVFIKDNLQKLQALEVDSILGFSSGLYASEDAEQMYAIESHVLHDACNNAIATLEDADHQRSTVNEMCGFMKVSQLKELLCMPRMHLALHGCCHLNLRSSSSAIQRLVAFKRDVDDGVCRLRDFNMQTRMFVYPYVYAFPASDACLAKAGFADIVGNRMFRMSVEDLACGKIVYDS